MCLKSVEKRFDIATGSSKKAWKIVRGKHTDSAAPKRSYETPCYPAFITPFWQVAGGTTISCGQLENSFSYPEGFHTFARKKDAQKKLSDWQHGCIYYKLIPVEIDEIHTQGLDMGCKTYVSNKIRLYPTKRK